MSEEPLHCQLAGCGGPASGVCLEGLSFDECKNVIREIPEEDVAPPVEEVPREAADDLHDLVRTGNEANLSAVTCDALLRSRGGVVVAIIAGPTAGKTTLIATLYELLWRRKMLPFGFAGSETIRGLEERCHLSRATSNLADPDTNRTSGRANVTFAHLRVASQERRIDIIFADRSGEHFERVLDTPSEIASFAEVVRADVRVLVVDGALLANNHHAEVARVRQLFLALQQARLVKGRPLLLVATKADLLDQKETDRCRTRLENLLAEFAAREPEADLRLVLTSARAKLGESEFGGGFADLLRSLIPPEPEHHFALPWPRLAAANGMDTLLTSWGSQ